MKSPIRSLVSDGLVYGAGSALNGLAGFVLLPILVRSLYAAEYGRYATAELFLNLLLVISGMGLAVVLPGVYICTPEGERRQLLTGVFLLVFIIGTAIGASFLALILVAGEYLAPQVPTQQLCLAAAIAVCETLWALTAVMLRIWRRRWVFMALSVLQFCLSLGLTLTLIVFFRFREEGILLGRLLADLTLLSFLSPYSRRLLGRGIDWRRSWQVMKLGAPLVPATLATVWIAMSPRLVLGYWTDSSDVGIFAMSAKVSSIISMLYVQPFALAWSVLLFRVQQHAQPKAIYARVLTYYWTAGIICALGVGVAAPYVITHLSEPRFPLSQNVMLITAIATIVSGLMYPLNVGIYITSRTTQVVPVFVSSAICATSLGSVMAHFAGINGVALTLLLTYAAQSVWLYRVNNALYPWVVEWDRVTKATLSAGCAYLIVVQLEFGHYWWSAIGAITVFTLTASASLLMLQFFTSPESQAVRLLVRRLSAVEVPPS